MDNIISLNWNNEEDEEDEEVVVVVAVFVNNDVDGEVLNVIVKDTRMIVAMAIKK